MKANEFKNFIAKYFSLKEEEVEVYRVILKNGPVTAGEIALYVGKRYEEVNNVLRALKERGLIVQLPGIVKKYIITPPYQAFTEYLSEIEKVIKEEIVSTKKKFEKYITKTERKIEKVSKSLTESLDNSTEVLKKKISTIENIIEDLASKSLEDFEKNLKNIDTKEESLLRKTRAEEETLFEEAVQKVGNIIDESSKDLTLTLNKLEEQIITTLSEDKKIYEDETSKWKTESLTIIKNAIDNLKSNFSNASNKLANLVTEMSNDFAEAISEISNVVDTSYKNGLSLVENSFSTVQNKVVETLDEGFDIQKEEISRLSDRLSKTASQLSLFFNNAASEIRTSIESDLNTWLGEQENYLKTLMEKTKEMLSTSKVTAVESLDRVDEEITSRLASLKNNFLTFLKDVNANVNSYLQKDLERIKEKFAAIEKETNQILLDNLRDYEEVTSSLETSAINIVNTSTKALTKTQKIVEETIQSKLSSALESYKTLIEDLLGNATATIESVKEAIGSKVNVLKDEFQKELKTSIEEFTNKINTLKQELESAVSSGLLKIREETETAKKTVKETISIALSDIRAIVEALERKLVSTEKYFSEAIETEANRISESINTIREISEEKITEYEQLLKNIASQVEQSALATIYNCFEEFSKGLEVTETNITTNLDTNLGELNQIFADIGKDVNTTLLSWVDSTTQEAKKIEDIVRKTFSQIVEEYRMKNENMRSTFQKKIQRLLEKRKTETQDVIERINSYTLNMEHKLTENMIASGFQTVINQGKRTIEENISSYSTEMEEEFYNQLEKAKELTSKIIEDTRRKLDTVLQKTENYTVNSSKDSSEIVNNILNRLTKITEDAKETISNITLEHLTGFKETWIADKKDILTRLQADNNRFNKKLEETKGNITELLDMSSELLKTSTESLKTSIYTIFDNHLQQFGKRIENLEELLKSSIDEKKRYQAELYTDVQNKIKEFIATIKQSRNKIFEVIENTRTNLTSNLSALTREFVNNISQKILQSLSLYLEEYISGTADLSGRLEKHLAELPKEIKALIDKLDIEKYAKKIIRKTEETREVLMHIWEEIKKIKPLEIERIWYIMGKEAVLTYIKDVISRVEKSVTIVLPTLEEISLFEECIKSLKPTKRVYVIADVRIPDDNEKVRELLKLKYVRVRSRPQRDCYGVIRDGKEILIAPRPEEGEIIAVVSDKPEYVQLFQNLIGNIWIKQSKSIKEKDLH